jgi:hypothetical protein
MWSCSKPSGTFVALDANDSGIDFFNTVKESDSINIFDFENIYNGGGVGVGDFNNDGLLDIYFTGNMVPNKLYLNQGNLSFKDITNKAGVEGGGVWSRGVTVIDINNDGLLDMYISATAYRHAERRRNLLYINEGINAKGEPVFKNKAREYGLDDTTQTTMAYFFDYDRDNDLDVYLAVNHILEHDYPNVFSPRSIDGSHPSCGRLYRNDFNQSLKHPVFTNVSKQAGIVHEGYTHAVNIIDINNDGWPDIQEANDYISNNVLYINNRDGTFTDRITDYFKHTALNAMGTDAVDLNNDGYDDLVEVDMAPQDNYRKKMFGPAINYTSYINSQMYNYQFQYIRNMVQANMGPMVGQQDSILHPIFGDIGFYSGIAETDWSWTPLVADYDNDGWRDIIFTNGFPKDITDHDFATYRQQAFQLTPKMDLLKEIPSVKIHNYAYKNSGDFKFDETTFAWGFEAPTYSSGAAYADLDNDGDLDIIINNFDQKAQIYENRLSADGKGKNFLDIKLKGPNWNIGAIGARVKIFQKGLQQSITQNPYRGYISSVSPILHFGLSDASIDSIEVKWPDGKMQTVLNPSKNQVLSIDYNSATSNLANKEIGLLASDALFTNITHLAGLNYTHYQRDFIDFNIQKLLPHKLSEYSPAIAVGDLNGDSFDDFIVAATTGRSPTIFFQRSDGTFSSKLLLDSVKATFKTQDERGLLLFDADNDKDLDLFVVAGGYSYAEYDTAFTDQLFVNDGKGNFKVDKQALPVNNTSKLCVRACDYDVDGDMDLFVSGRVKPYFYPKAVSSFIYRNDSKVGQLKFTDVTRQVAPELIDVGLISDALFSDYDNDNKPDLLVAGEWMPLQIFKNFDGKFKKVSNNGLDGHVGWWNSLSAADFDDDGDIDYVAGNLGSNSFFRANNAYPVRIRAKDFDNNGSYDAVPSVYLKENMEQGSKIAEYPANSRDDLIKQMLGTKGRFQNYKQFATATIDSVLTPAMMKGALTLSANFMQSAFIRNNGKQGFEVVPLPSFAQMSVLNAIVSDDFDGDGITDVFANTNDYSADPNVGRYDALNGMVLAGKGNGAFQPLSMLQSGVTIPGNGKALVKLLGANGKLLVAATQNRGPLLLFSARYVPHKVVRWQMDDAYAMVSLKDGRTKKFEAYYGDSFLSQSSRFFTIGATATKCIIANRKGQIREVKF